MINTQFTGSCLPEDVRGYILSSYAVGKVYRGNILPPAAQAAVLEMAAGWGEPILGSVQGRPAPSVQQSSTNSKQAPSTWGTG